MRRYRMTAEGEQPVWASKAKLRDMGAEDGRRAAREGHACPRMSNTTYDAAAKAAYDKEKTRP